MKFYLKLIDLNIVIVMLFKIDEIKLLKTDTFN